LIEAEGRKKNGWLPILTALFLISYALMTMLIVEQGQTIDSQRALIRELFRDSKALSDIKLKQGQQTAQAGHAAAPQKIAPQLPSTQAPRKAPSSQAGSQFATQDRAAQQKPFRTPSRPGTEVADSARSLITI
jgi:hypothetical protein